MRLNDGTGNRQSQTCPLRLGGEERVENAFYIVSGKSHTGINDRDEQLAIFGQLRLDAEFTACVSHCLNAIEHEIHEHLLQLHTVCHRSGKILGELSSDGNGMPIRLVLQHEGHLFNDFVYVNCLKF
jgi:hypothetical protein